MQEVIEVKFGVGCRTKLWVTQQVQRKAAYLRALQGPNGKDWLRLKRYSKNGYSLYERSDWPPIKHEWDGVFRIGFRDSLFRIVGFYETDKKENFIAIDAFLKRGQKLNAAERRVVDDVARIKQEGLWRKVGDDSDRQNAGRLTAVREQSGGTGLQPSS